MRRYIASIAEDVKVPAVVFDALAPLIVARADGTSASAVPKPAERRKAERRVRKWVLELLRSSLAIGSVGLGIGVHDIVRDYARSRVQAEEGGLAALQRSVVTALLQALPSQLEFLLLPATPGLVALVDGVVRDTVRVGAHGGFGLGTRTRVPAHDDAVSPPGSETLGRT